MWSCDPATRLVLAALTGLVAAALGRPALAAAVLLGRPRPLLLVTAAVACWWGLVQVESIERRSLSPGPVHATAVVTGQPRGARAIAQLRPAREDVVLVAPGERLEQGAVYEVRGRLRPLDAVVAGYYATQGAHLELRASTLVLRGRRQGVWGIVDGVHRGLVAGLGGDRVSTQRALVEGIVLGEDGALSRGERERFQSSGLYHLVSVYHQAPTVIPLEPGRLPPGGAMHLIGYVRVSRVAGRSGESFISPDTQREKIEAWCRAYGHQVRFLEDELDASGGTLERPVFQEALRRCEAGESDGIIVAKLDRFSRSVNDALTTIRRLQEAGAVLISVAESFDPTTPVGKMAQTVLLAFAQLEREQRAEGWDNARGRAVKRGVHVASKAPTGYERGEDGRLRPNPKLAPAIRELFLRRAQGAGISELRDYLQERDVSSPYGAKGWTDSALRKIIANPTYTGEARSGSHINKDAHPSIVSEAEWRAAQRARGFTAPARGGDGGALLSSIIRCAGCRHGAKADSTRDRKGHKVRQYRCRVNHAGGRCPAPAAVSAGLVEAYVVERFFAAIGADGILARPAVINDALHQAQQEAQEAQDELDAFLEAVSAVEHGREAYGTGVTVRKERLDAALREVDAAASVSDARARLPEATTLAAEWPNLTTQAQRKLIAAAFDAVMLRKGPSPISERVHIITAGKLPNDFPRRGRRTIVESFTFPE